MSGFAGSMAAYAALVAGLGAALRAGDRELPETFPVTDLFLGGVATHQLSLRRDVVGTAYVAGLVAAPRPTRAAAAVLSVVAISDALQQGYARMRQE